MCTQSSTTRHWKKSNSTRSSSVKTIAVPCARKQIMSSNEARGITAVGRHSDISAKHATGDSGGESLVLKE